jgi:type I restriction enzyme, S subunit
LTRYRAYKDSGIEWLGDVPASWLTKRLKFVSQIASSGVWGEDPIPGIDEYRVATTANIDSQGNINTEGMSFRSLSERELELGECQPGDLIVVKSSGSATNVVSGKAGLVKEEHLPICFSNFTMRVRPTQKLIEPRFLWRFLNSEVVKSQVRLMVSTTTYPNLQVGEYASFYLPLPTYKEQQAIADYLDRETLRLDGLIMAKERVMSLLSEKRAALVTRAIIRGLDSQLPFRDSKVAWLGKIPAHWEIERARWLFKERDQRSETGDEELLSVSHLTGVTPRSEKDVNMFEAETTEGYKLCLAGDLVINTLWAWMGHGCVLFDRDCEPFVQRLSARTKTRP